MRIALPFRKRRGDPVSYCRGVLVLLGLGSGRASWGCAALFHAVWGLTFGVVACCFRRHGTAFSLFMMVTATLALANWWALWGRRRALGAALSPPPRALATRRFARAALVFLVVLVVLPSAIVAIMIGRSKESAGRCNECLFHMPAKGRMLITFLLQAARQVVNCGLGLAVVAIYGCLCLEARQHALDLVRRCQRQGVTQAELSSYHALSRRVRRVERALSPSVFLVFCGAFNEFFRALAQILFNGRHSYPHLLVLSTFYSTASLAAFLVPLFCADALRAAAAAARAPLPPDLRLLLEARGSPLTAWGMFEVRRGLLLTATASIISYGVIVGQMTAAAY